MKILFVCPTLTNGGAERVCVCWANGLSALGHEVDILIKPNARISYYPDKDVRILHLPKTSNFILRHIPLLRETLSLRKLLKQNNYDVVIEVLFYLYFPIRFATWMCSPRIPAILTSHDAMERPSNVKHPIKFRFIKFFANRFYDHITVLTKRDALILQSKGISKVTVLNNPVFLKPRSVKSEYKKKIVLTAGRIDVWFCKGFDLLIEAWNSVYSQFPDWKLRIIGSGSEKSFKYLQSLIKDKASVEFSSYTSSIEDHYIESSVFCLASRYEGWGLVLTEAMSRGCAVIACDFNGRQSEIIRDGLTGLLCETQNVNELASKLKEVIMNEDLRRTLQKNASKDLNHLNISNISKKLEQLIINVCKSY